MNDIKNIIFRFLHNIHTIKIRKEYINKIDFCDDHIQLRYLDNNYNPGVFWYNYRKFPCKNQTIFHFSKNKAYSTAFNIPKNY